MENLELCRKSATSAFSNVGVREYLEITRDKITHNCFMRCLIVFLLLPCPKAEAENPENKTHVTNEPFWRSRLLWLSMVAFLMVAVLFPIRRNNILGGIFGFIGEAILVTYYGLQSAQGKNSSCKNFNRITAIELVIS